MVALVSYFIARVQTNARKEELSSQLYHQEQEAKLDRVIEARRDYLTPLRKAVSEWMKVANDSVSAIARVKAAETRGLSVADQAAEIKHLTEVLDNSQEITSELEILRGQGSDLMLESLITEAQSGQSDASMAMLKLGKLFNDPQNVSTDDLEAAVSQHNGIIQELRKKLLEINKRIEQLLTGEPSK